MVYEDFDVSPRYGCAGYEIDIMINGHDKLVLLTKEDFDRCCRGNEFVFGPMQTTFGTREGEPYAPFQQAYGLLRDGRGVYCEISDVLAERVEQVIAERDKNGN